MRALFINGNRSGYTPEQCGKTMTVNDLIERLEEIRDWNDGGDLPIYLYNDNDYTYGEITEHSMDIGKYEDGGDIEFEDGVFEDYDWKE